MSKVTLGRSEIIIASRWDEFSTKDLEALAAYSMKQLPHQTFKVYAMLYLTGLRPGKKIPKEVAQKKDPAITEDVYVYHRGRQRYWLTPSLLVQMSHCLSWLFQMDAKDNSIYLDVRLLRCPYPAVRHGGKLLGPGDALERITYEQFMWAQAYEQRMSEHPEDMSCLLACLWHSGKTFDPERVEGDAARIRELSPEQVMVMYWLWMGTMKFFEQKFPHVFGGGEDGDGGNANVFEEQQKIVDALANGDVTRKPAIREALLYDTLYTMEQSLVRQQQRELRAQRK